MGLLLILTLGYWVGSAGKNTFYQAVVKFSARCFGGRENWLLQVILWSPHICYEMCTHMYTQRQLELMNIIKETLLLSLQLQFWALIFFSKLILYIYFYTNLYMYIYVHTTMISAYDRYYKHSNPQEHPIFSRLLIMLVNTYSYLDKSHNLSSITMKLITCVNQPWLVLSLHFNNLSCVCACVRVCW